MPPMSKITDPVQLLQSAASSLYWWKQHRRLPRNSNTTSNGSPSSPTSHHNHHHSHAACPNGCSSNAPSPRGALNPHSPPSDWRRRTIRHFKLHGQPRRMIWNVLGVLILVYALFTLKFLHQRQLENQDEQDASYAAAAAAGMAVVSSPDGESGSGDGEPTTTTDEGQYAAYLENWDFTGTFQNVTNDAPVCTPLAAHDVTYTLVTQTSANRLWMMQDHCERWGANRSMSVAVYSTDPTDTLSAVRKKLQRLGCDMEYLQVQVLADPNSTMSEYPINILRNMAMRAVKTTHLVYIDMDFWPSTDLYEHLMKRHVRLHLAADDKAALVIPAFMYLNTCPNKGCRPFVPHTQKQLLPLLQRKRNPRVTRFDRKNSAAHGTTRYDEWATSQSSHELLPLPCTESNRYEPYLVVRWCDKLPPFQEVFTGYGKNKITWILHLRRLGWTMHQIGESFVVHYPHTPSEARVAWDGGPKSRQNPKPNRKAEDLMRFETDRKFMAFKHWLLNYVPDEMRLPACELAENDDSRLWIKKTKKPTGGSSVSSSTTSRRSLTSSSTATTSDSSSRIPVSSNSSSTTNINTSSSSSSSDGSTTTATATSRRLRR